MFSFEVLKQKQTDIGETAFLVEYMLVPLRSLDSFFNREQIEAYVAPSIRERIQKAFGRGGSQR